MDSHEEIVQEKNLPKVGQTVRSREHHTLWKVIEKRQIFTHSAGDPEAGDFKLVPAIYLIYWKIKPGMTQGIGKMLGYAYTLHDNTFESHWEIVS